MSEIINEMVLNFVNQPSNSLLCPVCREVCQDPLITGRCHHSYCSNCIYQAINVEPFCPLCRCRLNINDLHPNLALASLINELFLYCPNKNLGCNEPIRFDGLNYHLKNCPYLPINCEYLNFGCEFNGSLKDLENHLNLDCWYHKGKGFLNFIGKRMEELELKVKKQNLELIELKSLLNRDNSVSIDQVSIPTDSLILSSSKPIIPVSHFPDGDITLNDTLIGHTSGVTSLAYSNQLLFSGSHDGRCKVYDTLTNQILWDQPAHQTSIWGLAVFEDTKRFFTAGSDKLIKVWDFNSTKSIKTLNDHQGKVYSLLSRFGKLFSGSSDTTVKVYDARSLQLNATLKGHSDNVNCLVPLRNNQLATGSSDKTIKIWDVATSTCLTTIPTPTSELLDLTISPDHQLLFASTYDASIHVYSLPDHKLINTLKGHDWEVWQLQYSNGKLFSGSFDHTIKRWDERTWQCDQTLLGHKGFVHALQVGENKLYSGCADKTIKVWT